ncbi:MAG: glycosyltransferase family 2 protein [Rhodoglobus sp.]
MMTLNPRDLSTRPLVTVVIPCYNYGHFLPAAVASALDQDDVDVEVIIVDDASPDGSAEVARELVDSDSRVRLIAHSSNKKHILTYNDGLAEAAGDYVVLLSADDLLTKNSVTRAVALMEHHLEVGLVYGPVTVFDEVVPECENSASAAWVLWGGSDWARRLFCSGVNVIKSPEAIVRGSILRRVGLYDPDHPHAGDLQMWLRIAAIADVGYLTGTVQALYRQHDQNMHSLVFATDQAQGMITDLQHRLDAFTTAAKSFPNAEELITSIRRALAVEAMDLASRAYVWGLTRSWPVPALLAFARDCDPSIDSKRAGRAHRRRHRLGTQFSRRNLFFVAREKILGWRNSTSQKRTAEIGLPG